MTRPRPSPSRAPLARPASDLAPHATGANAPLPLTRDPQSGWFCAPRGWGLMAVSEWERPRESFATGGDRPWFGGTADGQTGRQPPSDRRMTEEVSGPSASATSGTRSSSPEDRMASPGRFPGRVTTGWRRSPLFVPFIVDDEGIVAEKNHLPVSAQCPAGKVAS